MGEYTDDVLEGFRCMECGEILLDGLDQGHPRSCRACLAATPPPPPSRKPPRR